MPSVSRVGDEVLSVDGTGYQCSSPMKTSCGPSNGNAKVRANGIFIVVQGDTITPHPKGGCSTDTSTVTSFSGKVRACGKGVARVGDQYASVSSNTITQGSSNVFAA